MNKIFNYILIIFYSFFQYLKKKKSCCKSGNILLFMEQPGVGDAVVSLQALYNLTLHLPKDCTLYIAAPKSIIHFLQSTDSTFGAKFIELDFAHKFTLSIHKRNFKRIASREWEYVLSFNRIGNYVKLLLVGCRVQQIIGSEFSKVHWNFFELLLGKMLGNLKIYFFSNQTMILTIYQHMVYNIFDSFDVEAKKIIYKFYKLPTLCENSLADACKQYCILCPTIAKDHNNVYRGWPMERFAATANFILEHSSCHICLCGIEADREDNTKLRQHIHDTSRVIDLTGKTSFKEWIEVIRGARFLLGNDSGYIHLAALLGVPSFAIAGYWNYGRFLPYPETETKLVRPVDIRCPMVPCCGCSWQKTKDKARLACDRLVKERGIYQCVDDISVEQVEKCLVEQHVLE